MLFRSFPAVDAGRIIWKVSTNARAAAHLNLAATSRHIGRVVLLVFLALLLLLGSAVATAWTSLQGNINQTNVDSLLGSDRPTAATRAPDDSFAGRALNILVLGSDVRQGASDVDGAGASGEISGMRADTTMLFHISADRSHVEVVSIPRDMLLDVPSCTVLNADGTESYTTRASSETMFNAAFSYGGLEGNVASAAACSMKTFEKLSGIRLDGFVVVDFASFKQIVEALDGVPMYFEDDLYDRNAGLNVAAGCRLLDGHQALALARARKQIGDGSDLGRIGRQQELVTAMIREILSLNLLTNLPRLYQVLDAATQSISTSSGLGNITTLVGLANSLKNVNPANIHFITMPFDWAGNRVRPDKEEGKILWNALIQDHPAIGEKSSSGLVTITDLAASTPAPGVSSSTAPGNQGADTTNQPATNTTDSSSTVGESSPETITTPVENATTPTHAICTKENAQ